MHTLINLKVPLHLSEKTSSIQLLSPFLFTLVIISTLIPFVQRVEEGRCVLSGLFSITFPEILIIIKFKIAAE